ncbi:MAG: transglycosylase SLT domain-containing protein [Candidatus Margulisiibacteriota bacterium]
MKKALVILISLLILTSLALAETIEAKSPLQELQTGYANLAQNKTVEAISHLEVASSAKGFALPEYSSFLLGEAYYSSKDFPRAIQNYSTAITKSPKSSLAPRALLMITKSYLAENNFERSISNCQYLIKNYPDCPQVAAARLTMAEAIEKSGDFKKAYIAYNNVDLYHPFSTESRTARLKIKALQASHKKALPRFQPTAKALYNKAMLYWDNGDLDSAIIYFSKLAKEYPTDKLAGKALLMLGRAEMDSSKIDEAISQLEKASSYQSQAGLASYYLALAQGKKENYEKAISILQGIQQKYPESEICDRAYYYNGYYLELSDKPSEALDVYWNLLDKHPNSDWASDAVWRIGRIYYWSGKYNDAFKYFSLVGQYPHNDVTPRAMFFQAKAAEKLTKNDEAILIYKKLAGEFDYTYYAYRAKDRLKTYGIVLPEKLKFTGRDFREAIDSLNKSSDPQEELTAIMDIWQETYADKLNASKTAKLHLNKCKLLLSAGITNFAVEEALAAINVTSSDNENLELQSNLNQLLQRVANYRAGIRLVEKKMKKAILAGKPDNISTNLWHMAYPRGYFNSVAYQAAIYNVDPYLILAVIREESRFNTAARSRSSARGLMQIMPSTGRAIAKDLKYTRYGTSKLNDPKVNIDMGTYYLSNLLRRFNGNPYLALAGYNGGPNRVKRYVNSWYNGDMSQIDIDEFVESLPIKETRLYVQKVMESYFMYKRIYGQG